MSKHEIIGRYVDVAGGRVHYDEMGEGQPVVLIHTLHSCSLEYRYLLPLLAQRGYHAMALDLPGNSRSYPPNWTPLDSPHAMAEFIWAFARKVCNGVKPVVSGCSIGGNLTIQLVVHHSAEILAGIAMEGGVYTPSLATLDDLRLPANFPAWSEWLERASTLSLNRKARPELVQELLWTHRFTAHVTGVPESNCWTQQDLRGKVGKLACPLLVLVGDEDFYLPPEFLELTKAEIPDCETRVLKGIGHYPMMEDPPLIAQIIDEFARSAQKR